MRRRSLLAAVGVAAVAPALLARPAFAATSPALFVAAHPDDETLAMGVTIAEHLVAGQDVHVLLVTDGEGSGTLDQLNGVASVGVNPWWGVLHNPAAEGYSTLAAADLAAARVREATEACQLLATGFTGTLTIHRASLPDGGVTTVAAQAAILAVCDSIAPGSVVRLKGHTYKTAYETHPDHLAVGQALLNLSSVDPARFSDRRHYVEPGYWPGTLPSGFSWDTPTDSTISGRVKNACRAYGAWAPAVGSYAIGWHSKSDWFTTIQNGPRCLQHS